MWDRVKSVFVRLGSAAIVKSPLWLFASCAGFVGFELHTTLSKLAETRVIGLVVSAMLLAVLSLIIVTVGKLATDNPAGLYSDMGLLRLALKSKITMGDALGKLMSDRQLVINVSRETGRATENTADDEIDKKLPVGVHSHGDDKND